MNASISISFKLNLVLEIYLNHSHNLKTSVRLKVNVTVSHLCLQKWARCSSIVWICSNVNLPAAVNLSYCRKARLS